MQFTKKLYLLIKIRIFICLVLCMNFSFSNTKGGSTSNSKLSPSDINDFNEKTKQEKKEEKIKNSSNNNVNGIMSTVGDCTATCCAGNNTLQEVGNSKKKLNNQKAKKKFRWFSRSK